MIWLENVSFRYPGSERWILEDLSLRASKGEIVRIVGRNGSGKSTLLKLISQSLEPTSGRIGFEDGKSVYMDQNAGDMLAQGMTINEHFSAFSEGGGRSMPSEADLSLLGLNNVMSDFVGHRSNGQKQIISLLVSLHTGASVLCLDEFSAALDHVAGNLANSLIAKYAREKGVVFFIVSHNESSDLDARDVDLR